MRVSHRFLCIAAAFALEATVAFGQTGITIDGPQGHSTAFARSAAVSSEPTVSYWEFMKDREAATNSGQRPNLGPAYRTNIQYAGAFRIARGSHFRDLIRDRFVYRKGRFDAVQSDSRRTRVAPPRHSYRGSSGIRYTQSFRISNRFRSRIRYASR